MAYTYSDDPVVGGTAAQKRDAVRFLCQDNQANASSAYKLTDAEIAFLIANEANVYMAAGMACDIIANRGGALSSKKVGDLELQWGSREDYVALGQKLKARGMTYQLPTIGGISYDDKETLTNDTDWIKPLFARRMQENPGTTTAQAPLTELES
jgi:hypothetical protein